MIFADGGLPTPTPEQLGLWIVCAGAAMYIFTRIKDIFWPSRSPLPRDQQFVARAELAERIAVQTENLRAIGDHYKELDAYTHESVHRHSNDLGILSNRMAVMEERQTGQGKTLDKLLEAATKHGDQLVRIISYLSNCQIIREDLPGTTRPLPPHDNL